MTNRNTSSGNLKLVTSEIDEWVELDLVPEERETKGSKEFTAPQLKGWMALGRPLIRNLPTLDNPELSNYEFYHVLLATSFRPEEGAPFDRVWVQVELETDPESEAVAWSMHPRKETTQIDVARRVGINGKVGLEWVSSEGKIETERKFTEHEVFLIAYNEMRSDPIWEFITTEQVPIMGSYRLHLVVRKTPKLAVNGTVSVTATVKHRRFGLFTYKSRAKDTPPLSFIIA